MADSSSMEELQNRLRVTQLRAVDTFASGIVEVAGRTALYNYDQSGETWSKTDVEGTLMIYTRSAKPKHMITIINKNSKANFVEPITRNCDAQLKAPYVLLRNDSMNILGIWFAEQCDVPRIYEAIGKFIRIEEHLNLSSAGHPTPVSLSSQPSIAPLLPATSKHQITANTMDIMSMLSRAHGEFETKKSDGTDTISAAVKNKEANKQLGKSTDLIKPSPVKLASSAAAKTTTASIVNKDSTSNSQHPPQNNTVADFFAKVSLGPPLNSNPTPNKHHPHRQSSHENTATSSSYSSPNIGAASAIPTNNNCNANPVLQQMFQGAAAVGGQASVDNSNCIGSNPVAIPQGPRETRVQNCTPSNAGVVGSLKKAGQPAPMSLQELEGKLRENLTVSGSSGSGSQDSYLPFNDLLLGVSPTSSKPNLIGPQMFTIGKPLIDDLSPNNNSVHHKSTGLQPLLTPQDEHAMAKRVFPHNSNEINSVPFRIIPQTPPGLSTTLTSPHAVSHAATASIQSLLVSNSYNSASSSNNNNSSSSNNPSDVKDSFVRNNNDLRLFGSRPPGMLQQPPLQQPIRQVVYQDRQAMLLNQEQFVTALSHALTKEDFVRQLYQAYEESVLLKSNQC